jgi:hypothetical protein
MQGVRIQMTTFHTERDYDEEEGDPRERLKICYFCDTGQHHLCQTISCKCSDSSHKVKAVEDVALD